jgi:hypothetical protein
MVFLASPLTLMTLRTTDIPAVLAAFLCPLCQERVNLYQDPDG